MGPERWASKSGLAAFALAYTNLAPGCLKRSALHHPLIEFLIDDLDRSVDLGIGHAELVRNQFYQQVDPLDEGRSIGPRPGRRRWLEEAFRRFGIFLEGHLIRRVRPETPSDRIDVVIDGVRELQIIMHGVADRFRFLQRDAAVIPG